MWSDTSEHTEFELTWTATHVQYPMLGTGAAVSSAGFVVLRLYTFFACDRSW